MTASGSPALWLGYRAIIGVALPRLRQRLADCVPNRGRMVQKKEVPAIELAEIDRVVRRTQPVTLPGRAQQRVVAAGEHRSGSA